MPSGSFAPGDHFECVDDFFDDCDEDVDDCDDTVAATVGDDGVGNDIDVDAATDYDDTAADVDDDDHLHSRLQ